MTTGDGTTPMGPDPRIPPSNWSSPAAGAPDTPVTVTPDRRGKRTLVVSALFVLIAVLVASAVLCGMPLMQWVLEATSPLPRILVLTPTSITQSSPASQQSPTVVAKTVTPGTIPTAVATTAPRSYPTSTPAQSQPLLRVSPSNLSSVCQTGQFKSFTVDNTGGGVLYWSATPSVTSVTLQPIGGSLYGGQSQRVALSGNSQDPTFTIVVRSNANVHPIITITYTCT